MGCTPASVATPGTSACTITLSSAAPTGGASVGLSSSNISATVPATVVVSAGGTTANFKEEVYRDLYRLKSSKVLSFGERKMLDNAKQLIVKELAVARKWTEEKVEAELEKACA